MSSVDRRFFLKTSGLAFAATGIPSLTHAIGHDHNYRNYVDNTVVLWGDGEMFEPSAYIAQLHKINSSKTISADMYGKRGAVAELEKKFQDLTGKEKAVFMPTGTLANQLAIFVLSGENTKVFVQETSHVFRDEADAAQSIFNKRLIPLAKEETYFTADQLKAEIDYHNKGEVFKSGMGVVSIENPVRRADGRMIPMEEIRKIHEFCRTQNLKLHLDGARLFMASAWSGITIKEYASYFDTVYISLYKYLGAGAGAVLCGEKPVIDKMEHLIKVHGGTMFSNWANAAMALDRLESFESRLLKAIKESEKIFTALNRIKGLKVSPLTGGTNIYSFKISNDIDHNKFVSLLNKDHQIRMIPPDPSGNTHLYVNETLLYKESNAIIDAFEKASAAASKK